MERQSSLPSERVCQREPFAANCEKHAFEFKTLSDAMRIRNHIIDVFERAEAEPNPERRRALLTFVVAGGGFSGPNLPAA
jgi:NADH:ubiquinone reductase (H+-translocating)